MSNKEILEIVINSKGISTDTRTIKKDQVFFALKGDNFDGNEYVELALKKGAVLVISSDYKFENFNKVNVVKDTLATLQDIARLHRRNFKNPVIAITGTNGKTTTKELVTSLLSAKYNVLSTSGNFNNHIGVPLTLLKLNINHQIAIIEMGASAPGEILKLCEIAEPTHGIITSIGKAHIEGFGSLENILNTKLELFDYLNSNDGLFFFNEAVDALHEKLLNKSGLISFSAENIGLSNINSIELQEVYPFLELSFHKDKNKIIDVKTKLYGSYNFDNLVNAIKVALYFHVELSGVIEKIKAFKPQNNRSQILTWESNQVILDAYNANPTSMIEAIKSFEKIDSDENKYLVLGDMLEMGTESVFEHEQIIKYILGNNNYERVFLIGKDFFAAGKKIDILPENIFFNNDSSNAKKLIESLKITHSIFLVKGSRGIKTETIFI